MIFWVFYPVVSKPSLEKYMSVARPSPSYAGTPELIVLGVVIRQKRALLGFSQEAFADAAGIDRSYLGGIERGEHNFAMINLFKIAKALGITVTELLQEAKL